METAWKSVRFDDQVVVVEANKKYCIGPRLWYSDEECDAVREESLKWMKRGKTARKWANSALTTPRGYEYVYMKYSRKDVRQEHMKRVLEFIRSGNATSSTLMELAATTNASSLKRARKLAIGDETEARKIYQEGMKLDYPLTPNTSEINSRSPSSSLTLPFVKTRKTIGRQAARLIHQGPNFTEDDEVSC